MTTVWTQTMDDVEHFKKVLASKPLSLSDALRDMEREFSAEARRLDNLSTACGQASSTVERWIDEGKKGDISISLKHLEVMVKAAKRLSP